MSPTPAETAKMLRDKAAACRRSAETVRDPGERRSLLELARGYEERARAIEAETRRRQEGGL